MTSGLSYFRVPVTGYFPTTFVDRQNDLAPWQSDPQAFWRDMDDTFAMLDNAGIKLVPVFIWNFNQFPVLKHEKFPEFLRTLKPRAANFWCALSVTSLGDINRAERFCFMS